MAKIKVVEPLVMEALINNKESRKDNFVLYVEVLKHFINPKMSLEDICLNHKILGIPSLESITRCRRKIQEENPKLKDPGAAKIRAKEEKEYKEYAKINYMSRGKV